MSVDRWVCCEDGTYVRWSAVEMLQVVPNGKGWDAIARLHRGLVTLKHFEKREEAQGALQDTIRQFSHDFG